VTLGDCDTPQPGMWSVEARAKWNGWEKMKGLCPSECRTRYLEQLDSKVPKVCSYCLPIAGEDSRFMNLAIQLLAQFEHLDCQEYLSLCS